MRLPTSKVYRAFPELDRFADDRCEVFVRNAEKKAGAWFGVWMVLWLAAACGAAFATVAPLAWLIECDQKHWGVLERVSEYVPETLRLLIGIIVMLGAPGVTGALAFLGLRDRWLRRALRREIDSAACPECGYTLLGLPVQLGEVRCPECGTRHTLIELGKTPEELLAPTDPLALTAPSAPPGAAAADLATPAPASR